MSDYLAIAGVSESLKALLEDRMHLTAPDTASKQRVTISISHPDVKPGETPTGPRLNLFLYEISHSPFLRNQELGGPGGEPGFPPLALELHYLMSCYPPVAEDDLTMQIVLGDAMQALHSTPVLTEDLVRTRGITAGDPILSPALAGAYERAKITFHTSSHEIANKLWVASKEAFRLSVAFSVSVVQIESIRKRPQAALVRERQILSGPAASPHITQVIPDRAGIGQLFRVSGANLGGQDVTLSLNGVPVPLIKSSDTEVVAAVPDNPALQPGGLTVQVSARGFRAAPLALTLVPRITQVALDQGKLVLTGTRLTGPGHQTLVSVGAATYEPDTATPTRLEVTLAHHAAGTYPVRVRVGDVESVEATQVALA